MTQPRNRIPGPVYAAAGAGDLAYRKLRRLPAVLSELSDKAAAGTAELRERAVANSADLRQRARSAAASLRDANVAATGARSELDLDRLRAAARRNAAAFVAGAHTAQVRATAVYEDLVARGARVIGGSADAVAGDAEIESEGAVPSALPAPAAATPTTTPTTATPTTTPATVTATTTPAAPTPPAKKAVKATKAVKRTRPAAGE
jgi:heparin binding hemagglutinin HbhA